MSKTSTKTIVATTPARAKSLAPRDRLLAQQAAAARQAEEKRLEHNARVRAYHKRKRAERKAQSALAASSKSAAPVTTPTPAPTPAIAGLTKEELVATLKAQIKLEGAGPYSHPGASDRIAALRIALELAKHLA
jgi:hypothetical protein